MKWNKEKSITLFYFMLYLTAALTIALLQPLNDTIPSMQNPPDEHSRYKVPLYICNHGTIPTGYEEELYSDNCGWTYGFYTLLPYVVQGYTMRFVNLFTDSPLALLYTARLVNVVFGFIMAYIVLLLGRKLFKDNRVRWLFCFLVTFLPQSLFLHTYTNPDSMCLLSTALMLYALVRGYGDDFSLKSCAILMTGVIICALSYYNGYGFILGSILLFTAYFIKKEDGKWRCDWKPFLKKGIMISAVVLLCISWQFIRNYILYDGDIIGLTTMDDLVRSHGIIRETHFSQGKSLFSMLFGTTFLPKTVISFIANYGSATLYTWKIVYLFYLCIFGVGIAGAVFCKGTKQDSQTDRKQLNVFFHVIMVFCIVMPVILLIQYAYTKDYQAQGRYIMPALIPFMYYVTHGLEKLPFWKKSSGKRKNRLSALVMTGIVVSLLITVYVSALPYYLAVPVL